MTTTYTIAEIVELLEAANIGSIDIDYTAVNEWLKANPDQKYKYDDFPKWKTQSVLDESRLPEGDWVSEAYKIITARRHQEHVDKINAAIDALSPLVRDFIKANRRTLRMPEVRDLSHLKKLAMEDHQKTVVIQGRKTVIGKPPYQPKSGCNLKLKLKEAVFYDFEQASYADYARYVVPVEGELTGDIEVCKKNLWTLSGALNTANGIAGYGSTWEIQLHQVEGGYVVTFECRSSIAD